MILYLSLPLTAGHIPDSGLHKMPRGERMGSLMATMVLGFMVGILGTVLGGLGVLIFPRRETGEQSILVGISGGIMIAVVLWDLWPEAVASNYYSAVGGGVFGLVFILLAGLVVRRSTILPLSSLARTGLLMGMGIGVHNFPEGLALGTVKAAAVDWRRWLSLAGLMTVHNVPEGMVVAAALHLAQVSLRQVMLALFLVELPMACGALLGGLLGGYLTGLLLHLLGLPPEPWCFWCLKSCCRWEGIFPR